MKIRSGFVSNSSSCSFVVLGVRYTGDDVNDLIEKHDLHTVESDDDIIGISYFRIHDDDYKADEVSISPENIKKDFDKLKKIFGKDADIKWFSGIESC